MSAELTQWQGWVVAPPAGAIPLRHVLFAHPKIVQDVVEALGPDAGGTFAPPRIWREKDRCAEEWQPDGYQYVESEPVMLDDGEWSAQPTHRYACDHWEGTEAWPYAFLSFIDLLKRGELLLIGRPRDPIAPGSVIPFGSLRPGALESADAFASGVVELADRQQAYDVHVVQRRPVDPVKRAQGKSPTGYKKWLETALREKLAATDRPKKEWFVEQRQKFPKVTSNGASTSWAEIMEENPDLAEVYQAKGRPPKNPKARKPRTKNPGLSV